VKEDRKTSWAKWKSILFPVLQAGNIIGISEETLVAFACRLGEFLNSYVDPKSPEQLWNVASRDEQKIIAKLLIKSRFQQPKYYQLR